MNLSDITVDADAGPDFLDKVVTKRLARRRFSPPS
jgi:hypothetical protein